MRERGSRYEREMGREEKRERQWGERFVQRFVLVGGTKF